MSEWISTKVQLPENGQRVLFITDEGDIQLGYRKTDPNWNNRFYWGQSDGSEGWVDFRIKWWQPLPEHPVNQELQQAFNKAYQSLTNEQEQRQLIREIVKEAASELRIEITPFQAAILWHFYIDQCTGDHEMKMLILRFIEQYTIHRKVNA